MNECVFQSIQHAVIRYLNGEYIMRTGYISVG